MSNCVDLRHAKFTLTADEIDLPRFQEAFNRYAQMTGKDLDTCYADWRNPDNGNAITFYWFLCPHNVRFSTSGVTIELGEGRSIHTWRDLNGTCHVLGEFTKKDIYVEVRMKDLDAPTRWFDATLILSARDLPGDYCPHIKCN